MASHTQESSRVIGSYCTFHHILHSLDRRPEPRACEPSLLRTHRQVAAARDPGPSPCVTAACVPLPWPPPVKCWVLFQDPWRTSPLLGSLPQLSQGSFLSTSIPPRCSACRLLWCSARFDHLSIGRLPASLGRGRGDRKNSKEDRLAPEEQD